VVPLFWRYLVHGPSRKTRQTRETTASCSSRLSCALKKNSLRCLLEIGVVVVVGVLAVKKNRTIDGGLFLNGEGKQRSRQKQKSCIERRINYYLPICLHPPLATVHRLEWAGRRSRRANRAAKKYQHQRTSTSIHIATHEIDGAKVVDIPTNRSH
jgi:hypothetical protein